MSFNPKHNTHFPTPSPQARRLVVSCEGQGRPVRLAIYDYNGLIADVDLDDRQAFGSARELLDAIGTRWPA